MRQSFFVLSIFLLLTLNTHAQLTVKDQESTPNNLVQVIDEGSAGSIFLPSVGSILSDTKLYNNGGNLYWGPDKLGLSGIAGGWTDGGSIIYTTNSSDKVGIGTSSTDASLQVSGNDGVVFTGTYNSGIIPATGEGTRMMWYPKKAAFRVGALSGSRSNYWDADSIGAYSFAAGSNVRAYGYYAVSLGIFSNARGNYSFSMGYSAYSGDNYAVAMGYEAAAYKQGSVSIGFRTNSKYSNSIAIGYETTATNEYALALGQNTLASGSSSTSTGTETTASGSMSFSSGYRTSAKGFASASFGRSTNAESFGCVALGKFNIGGGNKNNWVTGDPIFEIGIGTDTLNCANALTVLKNGKLGLGTNSPSHELQIHETSSDFSYVNFTNETTGEGGGNTGVVIGLDAEENFRIHSFEENIIKFFINNGEKVRIASDGNFGIGTTSPDYKLEVNGDAAKTSGGTTWINSSDIRLKDIRGQYQKGLKEIISLEPIKFNYKKDNQRNLPSDTEELGFIAQEVREIFPEAVSEGKDGFLDFNMHPINVAMVNAFKEQQKMIEELKDEVMKLRKQIDSQQFSEK